MKTAWNLLTCLLLLSLAPSLQAVPTSAPGANLLGERFQSEAAGIALRPPAGSKLIPGAIGTPEVVSFVNEDRKWLVKLTRVLMDKPLPLTLWKANGSGIERAGVFEWVIDQLKTDRPGTQIIQQEVSTRGMIQMGLFSAKYSFGLETNLIQEAVIRSTTDMQYYVLSLTCPAPKAEDGKAVDITTDPQVALASETFLQMIDSVELLDQSNLRQDQEDRLLRTRNLFLNLHDPEKVRKALEPDQQLFRILRNGKDVGYTLVEEKVAHDLPRKGRVEVQTGPEGLLVGIRTRLMSDAGAQTDSESWYFSTFDARLETFYSVSYVQDPKAGKSSHGELGTSTARSRPVLDRSKDLGANGDPKDLPFAEEYRLEVTKLGMNVSNEPIVRRLPPYYLPQSLSQVLPRLLVTPAGGGGKPQTYLVAVWVTDASQVMFRYVDVEADREVILGSRRVRAVPVRDHIGLEGPVTIHYISPEGHYLGSVNEQTGVTVLASDAASIEKIWSNADLSHPGAADR
jgi:hypothetical protein